MTSVVIPLATGTTASRWGDNTELRYALRSLEMYMRGVGDVFLVGAPPKWIKNVTVIPATDHEKTYYKERNIFNKIMLACQDSKVSEDFLFMNDDHFLLSEFEAGEFPYYWFSLLREQTLRSDPYGNTARNTYEWFLRKDCAYFDVHAPIIYNKDLFQSCVPLAPWEEKYGQCIKTVYCEINGIEGVEYPDLKLSGPLSSHEIKEKIKDRLFFSTADNIRDGGMLAVFEELYPKKSIYER